MKKTRKTSFEAGEFKKWFNKTNHNNYFKAKTSRKIIICRNVFVARKFKTEKLAQNYLIKYPIIANFCTIKEINEKCVS